MGARSPLLKEHGDDFAWSLLDAAPDATLIVSGTGEIVFANDHAGQLFGVPADDLLGRPVEDLLPEHLRGVHRAHRTRYRAAPTVRTMGDGLELRARRHDGAEFPVEISLSPLRLGDDVYAVAAVRDISARVEAEEQLHRVVRTLDSTDDAVFIFDVDTLRYSFVNEGAVRMVGYTRDELLTMTPLHLDPSVTEAEYRRIIEGLVADDASALVRQTRLLRKDGSEVAVEKTLRSAPAGRDSVRWVIVLARDITSRLAAEEELRASRDALQEAQQLMAVSEDRERIARDLHDTVVQRLFGEGLNLQAALGGLHDEERTRRRLEQTIDGLDQTIQDLRTAVFSLQRSAEAPGGLRGRLLAVVTEATPALGFEPRLQFDGAIETTPAPIAEDLLPVLREALSNVAKHAHARNVRVTVGVADDVVLTVADDGVGVPDEVLGGRGTENLRRRAVERGGESKIERQASGGSLLTWRVPVEPPST